MNDIFQPFIVLSSDKKSARILAFSSVNVSTGSNRAFLIVNFENNRFMIKTGTGGGSPSYSIMAGKGGFDFSTGLWREGFYYARVKSSQSEDEWAACVDSKTQTVKGLTTADSTDCALIKGFFESSPSFVAADFLELNDSERIDLAGYLAFFQDPNPLPATAIPQQMEDVKHIPDSVVVE